MECNECVRLRRLLSPLEDPDFTANFLLVLPEEWMYDHVGRFNGEPAIVVDIDELYFEAFGEPHTTDTIKKLAHSLKALGWHKTFRRGVPYWVISVHDFENSYA